MYQSNTWSIPNVGEIGQIEDTASGQVLGLMEDATLTGTEVVMEPKDDPITDHQQWLRSTPTQGHFTLKNLASGTYLMGVDSGSATIAGNNLSMFLNEAIWID